MNKADAKAVIMVVDDTPENLKLLTGMLKNQGHHVVQFPRGAMALRAVSQNPPDLILLDIMMPEMDGFEVCRRLKADETLCNIPVIFISALEDITSKVRAFSQGGVDYVTKPYQEEEVLARVETHLSLRRMQQEIAAQKQQTQCNFEQLKELEAQRDQLVHMIVHDMRSPLQVILGYAECLNNEIKRTVEDKSLATMTEGILKSSKILQEMIATLLDVSRMESNEMPLEMHSCDLCNIISEALASVIGMAEEGVTLEFEPPPYGMTTFCDPKITRRIIENLLGNAIKFAGGSGPIRVALAQGEHGVKVEVQDNGPGIPPEYHKRIFEKFGQVAIRSEGREKYSTGLGLTFCKLAVEAQGGRIGVDSVVGKGSTFWFELPAKK